MEREYNPNGLSEIQDTSFLDHLLGSNVDGTQAEFLPVNDTFFTGYLSHLTDQTFQEQPEMKTLCCDFIAAGPTSSSDGSEQMTAQPRSGSGSLHDLPGSDGHGCSPTSAAQPKRKRWKNRTEQQEAVHKLAQLRYRERKKAKVESLRQTAEQLREQAAELASLKAANGTLIDANSFLETEIAKREAEAVELRRQLDSETDSSCASAGMEQLPRESMFEQLQRKFRSQVEKLRLLQSQLGQDPRALYSEEAEAAATPEQIAEVKRQVADVIQTCFQLARLEGPDLTELISANVEGCESLEEGWDNADTFRQATAALALSAPQRKALLKARKHWLRDLERLYAERQAINLHLISVLLPLVLVQPPPELKAGDTDDDAKVALIHQLEDNLRAEQRMWCQQDREMFEILTPLQGAMYISLSFPAHCDPLALVGAVHELEEIPI